MTGDRSNMIERSPHVSSTFEVSSPTRSSDGEPESRIIHFDATERRREKMRKAASGEKTAEATPSRPAPAAVKTAQAAVKAAPAPKAPMGANPWQPAPAAIGNSPRPAAAPVPAAKPAVNGAAHAGTNGAAKSAPVAAPVAKAAPAGGSMDPKALETFLINFVVEQTGYPSEMVELDADLEADLGIDSIKKAQLFGELAEHFEVTASADLSLDDFPTLRHVMNFLKDKPTRGAGGAAPTAPATNGVHAAAKPATNGVHTNGSTNGHHAAPAAKAAPVAAPAPVKAAPAPAAAPASAGMARADLEKFLVNFVVEQTGYPAEMVELDADLEADLGIDSIKKAQLFGELAEHFEVTASADLSLDDFPTLRHVCNFLADKPARGAGGAAPSVSAPAVAPATNGAAKNGVHAAPVAAKPAAPVAKAAAPVAAPAPAKAAPAGDSMPSAELEKFLINFVVEQTGYPSEMVELDADLEADLGIDSIKKAQLFGELAEHFEVTASADLSLDDFPTLRHVMNFLAGVPRRR
jgi:acyl carrier protein